MSKVPFDQRLSPETRLLLAASRPFLTDAEGRELPSLCPPGLDWQRLLFLVNWHRIPGLVYHNLEQYTTDRLPAGFARALGQAYEKNRQREMRLAAELVRLQQMLDEKGLTAAFFKGPILSIQLYGSLGLRHSRDIDLLMRPEDIEPVSQALIAEGYQARDLDFTLTPRQQRTYYRKAHHFTFAHTKHDFVLEAHWRLADNPHFLPPDFELKSLERARSVVFGGAEVMTFCEEDNFIYLCAHGAQHRWFRLKWLCDIAAWLRSPQPADWPGLAEAALRRGMERPAAQAVLLAERLLDAPLPVPLREMAARVEPARQLVAMAAQTVLHPDERRFRQGEFKAMAISFYLVKLKKGLKYKLSALSSPWIEVEDWKTIPLPDFLFPLYFVLRPILWLRQRFGAIIRPR